MIKLSNEIVKEYLYKNTINSKDLILICLIQFYKKIHKNKLENNNIFIKNLKQRSLEINNKLGYEFIVYLKDKNKDIFSINKEYEITKNVGFVTIPFNYITLKGLKANEIKLLMFLLLYAKKDINKNNLKGILYNLKVIKIFRTVKAFKKAFSTQLKTLMLKELRIKGDHLFFTLRDIERNNSFIEIRKEPKEVSLKEVKNIKQNLIKHDKNYKEFEMYSDNELLQKTKQLLTDNSFKVLDFMALFNNFMIINDINNLSDLIKHSEFMDQLKTKKLEVYKLFY